MALTPRSFSGSITDAFALALDRREPLWVPAKLFADARGWSIMNQLQGVLSPGGQINFSTQHPRVVKAWHRHHKQTDFWLCLMGRIRVGVFREDDGQTWTQVLSPNSPGVMVIPNPLWHGAATLGEEPAGLLYYVTHAYDPRNPDEDRRPMDSVAGFDWSDTGDAQT